jgi:hypothetical protein
MDVGGKLQDSTRLDAILTPLMAAAAAEGCYGCWWAHCRYQLLLGAGGLVD